MLGSVNILADPKKEKVGSMNIVKSVIKYNKYNEFHTGHETLQNAISHVWVGFSVQDTNDEEVASFTRVYALQIRNTGNHILEENVTEDDILGWLNWQIEQSDYVEYARVLMDLHYMDSSSTSVNM